MNSDSSKQKILGFDILKIVVATLIVFHHYQQVFNVEFYPINFFGGIFNFGFFVELFFIISGFLTLYSNKLGGGQKDSFKNYYVSILWQQLPVHSH